MDSNYIKELLEGIRSGSVSIPEGLEALKHFPAESLPDACLDHQRHLRTGIPEVIFGESKSAEQIISITGAMLSRPGPLLITRVDKEKAGLVHQAVPELVYHSQARMMTARPAVLKKKEIRGEILVLCAGTSDTPVAEEARVTAASLGHPVKTLYDVGVAGLHRLLAGKDMFRKASAIIVAAGMEGALPSVVGGLVHCPVIGVPTSVGYGAGVGGFAALFGMLNSCAPGVAVVNIDNGFGAGCLAASINRNMT